MEILTASPVSVTMDRNQVIGNGFDHQVGQGVVFEAGVFNVELLLSCSNNRIQGNAFTAFNCDVDSGTFATLNATFTGNSIVGNYGGMAFGGTCTNANIAFYDNQISANGGDGVDFSLTATDMVVTFDGNTMMQNGLNGVDFTQYASSNTLLFTATSNVFSEQLDGNGVSFVGDFADLNATFSSNTLNHNSFSGIFCAPTGTDTCKATFLGNTLIGNKAAGLTMEATGCDVFDLSLDGNQVIGNLDQGSSGTGGVYMTVTGTANIDIQNNIFSENSPQGCFVLYTGNSGIYDVNFSHNTVKENLGAGVWFNYFTDSTTLGNTLNVSSNDVSYNADSGIVIHCEPEGASGGISMTIAENTLIGNLVAGIGVDLNSTAVGYQCPLLISGNTAYYNTFAGIELSSRGSTNSSADLVNNTLQNNTQAITAPAWAGCAISVISAGASLCVTLDENQSDTGYSLTNSLGTLQYAPCDASSVNSGIIYTSGIVGHQTSCSSGSPCP